VDEQLEFTRRPHRPGDEEPLLDMLRAAFGRWPAVEIEVDAVDHLRWKLSSSPESPGLHRITEVNGEMASSVFCWVQRLKVGDRLARNIQGTDRVVHPRFQRRGLADAIGRWRRLHADDQPCDLQFNVRSGHPAMLRLEERARPRPFILANAIEVLSLPLDVRFAADDRPAGAVKEVASFDERIDAFWVEAGRPYAFMVARGKDYMNWRYADRRAGRFMIHIAEEAERLVGYVVTRISWQKGYIADLLALPNRDDVVLSLLAAAGPRLQQANVERIDWWLPASHPYQSVARALGGRLRREVALTAYPHKPRSELDLSFLREEGTAVHIAAGDTDLV
jgi:hypothetical protein